LERQAVAIGTNAKKLLETPNGIALSSRRLIPSQASAAKNFINFSFFSLPSGLVFTPTTHIVGPHSEHSIGTHVLQDAHIASTAAVSIV
jgi:hypothetical protein